MPGRVGRYVRLQAVPGRRGELTELLLDEARALTDSDGCELYVVNTSPTHDDAVWVTEVWRDRGSMDAALAREGVAARIATVMTLLDGTPQLIEVDPLGGRGL